MRNKFTQISIHAIAWTLLLLVPYLSTRQVIESFATNIDSISSLPFVTLSLTLIGIFYINYFILIPKLLLKKKYFYYVLSFVACIAASMSLSVLIFHLFDINPEEIEKENDILVKLRPIASANAFLMLGISIVASISLVLYTRIKQIEKEKLSAEVASLKAQINPHFLFNTLNSIYATAIEKSPQTAYMISMLSEMMRYSMKENQKDMVLVEEEMQYIKNYIELQKVRLDESIKLDYNIDEQLDNDLKIAPMLLIPFIENAFKHGVNTEQESHIKIDISIEKEELHLKVLNNIVLIQQDLKEKSGLGIQNTKNRLQLIYPNKHLLTINKTLDFFSVSLHINLS